MTELINQARLFPKEAAEEIEIAPATLRKYSQIIEEVINDHNFFQRTDQNIRTYSSSNIQLLKKVGQMSSELKKPVKVIVEELWENDKNLFEQTKKENDSSVAPVNTEATPNVKELMDVIDQQNQKIDQLIQVMDSFAKEMHKEFNEVKPIIQKSQQLIETSGEQTDQIKEDIAHIKKETEELKETTENSIAKATEETTEEKAGFFQRLFGKK